MVVRNDLYNPSSIVPKQKMSLSSSRLVKYLLSALSLSSLFVLLTQIFPFNHYNSKFLRYPNPRKQPQHAPLLGSEDSHLGLWYPSKGNTFTPLVADYNTNAFNQTRLRTPLFIAFTRNHRLLEQAVLSYIAAGWPREDIIVVDNSGTMDANNQGLLSPSNPFYLDYNLYRYTYGVSILQTPTLLTFAQIQNLYLRTAIAHRWAFFFWSHMDVAVLSKETITPYISFYNRILDILTDLGMDVRSGDNTNATETREKWALKFFNYDWFTLVNVEAWRTIGQWDTFIPYYFGDWDAYARVVLHNFTKDDIKNKFAGFVFDLAEPLSDLKAKFFPTNQTEGPNSTRYSDLKKELEDGMRKKGNGDRNKWQHQDDGGAGEPWTYNPQGFQNMWWQWSDFGKAMFVKKWGSPEPDLEGRVKLDDEFSDFDKEDREKRQREERAKREMEEMEKQLLNLSTRLLEAMEAKEKEREEKEEKERQLVNLSTKLLEAMKVKEKEKCAESKGVENSGIVDEGDS